MDANVNCEVKENIKKKWNNFVPYMLDRPMISVCHYFFFFHFVEHVMKLTVSNYAFNMSVLAEIEKRVNELDR